MVLNDVANRASLFVKRAAALNSEVLGHRDLHALDMVAIPERLEEGICRLSVSATMTFPFW